MDSYAITKQHKYTTIKVQEAKFTAKIAPDLKTELVLLNSIDVKNIIIDLEEVSYCDSSGLRAVLVANRLCEDAIGTFILCGLQPDVENLIKISMLHTVLLITDTVEEAEELLEKKENL